MESLEEGLRRAYRIGVRRVARSKELGLRNAHGFDPTPEEDVRTNGMGAAAEYLVSRITGLRWLGENGDGPDNGYDLEGGVGVRWTEYRNGKLIVRPKDRFIYGVLVTGQRLDRLVARGWIAASEAKVDQFWGSPNERPDAYWVPQDHLLTLRAFPLLRQRGPQKGGLTVTVR